MGTLYVVGTPIGNLEDITLRAIRILKEVDFIICEDTRWSQKLLNHYSIKKPLISYHQHSKLTRINEIVKRLDQKKAALVSDAGTPGIADPGNKLVKEVLSQGIKVEVVPGPSALIVLLSISGLATDKFEFLGFLPHKKGRATLFKKIEGADRLIIFYESPHRIQKTLQSLAEVLTEERQVVVGRELTKMFEEIIRGNAQQVNKYFIDNPNKVKGEFTVIVNHK
ncbi:MAG: 16S rRNA (cytidine(1402)-2'-O)-methyltransferase [Patescibacteria group bacterium]